MMTYLIPLLTFIGLCAGWAVFQIWLSNTDPEAAERVNRCDGCNGQCQEKQCATRDV